MRKLVEIDSICFNFWFGPIHKLFKFDVNFAVRCLLRILGPIIFSKRPMKMQNGPSKFGFLYVNEWEMGLWPIFRAHLYSGPEISLYS